MLYSMVVDSVVVIVMLFCFVLMIDDLFISMIMLMKLIVNLSMCSDDICLFSYVNVMMVVNNGVVVLSIEVKFVVSVSLV